MDIKILGHRKAAAFLAAHPKEYDVIMISSPDNFFAIEGSNTIPDNAKRFLDLSFDDISIARPNLIQVEPVQIQTALDFVKETKKLLVTCQAGVSRSSAMAYVIKSAAVGAFEALAILDPYVHHPNEMVVKLGSEILDLSDMEEYIHIWKNKAVAMQCENPSFDGID